MKRKARIFPSVTHLGRWAWLERYRSPRVPAYILFFSILGARVSLVYVWALASVLRLCPASNWKDLIAGHHARIRFCDGARMFLFVSSKVNFRR